MPAIINDRCYCGEVCLCLFITLLLKIFDVTRCYLIVAAFVAHTTVSGKKDSTVYLTYL